MVLAFAAAYFALEGEIKRRKLQLDPYTIVAVVAFAGIWAQRSGTSSIRLPTGSPLTRSKVLARCSAGFAAALPGLEASSPALPRC